jgi:hypothetical protein
VFEEVNLGAFSFDRGGTQLGSFSLVCLNDCAANANASNPKVLFDPNSGRYFATLMMCFDGACGGANWTKIGVYLAVSTSDDPLGGWTIYPNLFNFDKGNFQDQPKLGFSSDKVTVSANVYRGHSTCACDFLHEDLVVLQKSDLQRAVPGFDEPDLRLDGRRSNGLHFRIQPDRLHLGEFGGTAAGFAVLNDTRIIATTPAHAAGLVNVIVAGPGGTSNALTYTYAPTPTLTSITPSSGSIGGGQSVTIRGTNLTGTSSVSFATTPATFTVVNNILIAATTPVHVAGVVGVTAVTLGGKSNAVTYTYVVPPLPVVTSVSPTSGPTAGGTTVTIIGSHFTGAFAVKFGTTAATTFTLVADNKITATSPAHAAGTVDVRVTTAAGVSAIVAADHYTFNPPPVSAIKSVTPNTGPTAGGQTVTIVGSHFTGATDVRFGTTLATGVTVVSDTRITATTPAHGSTTTDVRVTSPAGTSAIVAADHFTFASPPAVASVSPGSGTRLGGQTVTITGTNFTAATSVKFGTTAATGFTVVNSTKITATTPAHGAVTVDVRVTTSGGTSVVVARDRYIYT